MLPKHGYLTREIYLEAPAYNRHGLRKVEFNNLRAIGDYCPNLERLDLNYPLRIGLDATEADLPPKIGVDPEIVLGMEAETVPSDDQVEQANEDVEMQDVEQTDGQVDSQADGQEEVQDDGQEEGQAEEQVGDGNNGAGPNQSNDDAMAAHYATIAAQTAAQRRVCAELDYIIKHCPLLQGFSIQWTGSGALNRFYHKIPKLKALRIWDSIEDEDLIATGKKCRELERFYLDGQETHGVTLEGLIRFINALYTKDKSRLRRLGLYYPASLATRVDMGYDMDDDMDDYSDMDDDDDDDGEGGLANPPHQQMNTEIQQSPLHQFLDVLSIKHPFLERLCLVGCDIKDETIPILGRFHHLQSLDISKPSTEGLSAVGISELVIVFRDKSLSSLDLSRHRQMSEDDMDILTGDQGLKTLRYIKVTSCPKLTGKYLVDEWVHPRDFVMEEGNWRPRDGAGKSLLEIGDGFKEQWNE